MLGNHKNVVLQFSGGKDSLACLYLCRPYWEQITVLWANTGDAFPETVRQMSEIRALVPRFIEVSAHQPSQIATDGYPSDVVPMWDTALGRSCFAGRSSKVQTPFSCCSTNLWVPMANATKRLGATLVIRGQRNSEKVRSPVRNGQVIDGIEYLFPIENWTGQAVRHYLASQGVELPDHYRYVDSSLDCQHCTAYLFENKGKFRYMKEHHPELHTEVTQRLLYIHRAVHNEMQHLDAAME